MPKKKSFNEKDLENLARGFDAPAKEDHLEKLREQARERNPEMQKDKEQEKEHSPLRDLFKQKDKERERDMDGRSR